MSAAAKVLDRLDGVKQTGAGRWIARCPNHQDKSPSLSIRETDEGRMLLHCFAGCPVDSVCDLTMHAAHGIDWHGCKIARPLKVAYLVGEGVSGFRIRLKAWRE